MAVLSDRANITEADKRTAVAAETLVLPTPPVPVKVKIRMSRTFILENQEEKSEAQTYKPKVNKLIFNMHNNSGSAFFFAKQKLWSIYQ
jgi:hypothetical protein